jgi:hypothetical protein
VASITQQAIAAAAGMSRRSAGYGVASGYVRPIIGFDPGRLVLLPAEPRTILLEA